MAKIRVMSPHLANMIAAGEVIERPSSVIKELVENSIDASAHHIEVDIYEAGKKKIIVKDDGEGMDEEDSVNCFTRHASSKLLDEYQLFKIKTMGFRGEALPSIASVSKVMLTTGNGKVGSRVEVIDEVVKRKDDLPVKGTTFEVDELFYNTPVRLKYLKSDYTEVASCLEVMQRLALSYPGVAFDFYIDDKLSFSTSGRGDLLEVIACLYGTDTAKRMEKIEYSALGYSFVGYIGKPELTRSTRYYMITIVNHRNVYVPLIQKAILSGYSNYIFNSKYPFVILDLEVDHSLVDVNVHPSKKEVRMSNDNEIASAVENAIKEKLASLNAIHDITLPSPKPALNQSSLFAEQSRTINGNISRPMNNREIQQEIIAPFKENIANPISLNYEELDVKEETAPSNSVAPSENTILKEEVKTESKMPNLKVIGQIRKTYIVLEGDDGFYLCDQHAANERINYEKFNFILNSHIETTPLLVPLIISLSPGEIAKLTDDKLAMLNNIGMEVEIFGLNAIKVSVIPTFIKEYNEEAYIEELINQVINDSKINIESLRKHVIATMACKASVKAHDELSLLEMEDLIRELFKCDNPTCCPHGRPTMIHFTDYDIGKMFKRTGF